MVEYKVGERFPHEEYLRKGEITVAMVNDAFFDVVVCLSGITPKEKETFRTGSLTMSLFPFRNVPFVIADFGNGFSFDVSINITGMNEEQQGKWLNEEANLITLFLVDADTCKLEAIRALGVNFGDELRSICENQYGHTTESVKRLVDIAMSSVDTKTMAENAIKKIVFK